MGKLTFLDDLEEEIAKMRLANDAQSKKSKRKGAGLFKKGAKVERCDEFAWHPEDLTAEQVGNTNAMLDNLET